jgi:hypothetical protein
MSETITPAEEAVAKAIADAEGNERDWQFYLPAARAAIRAHLEAIRELPPHVAGLSRGAFLHRKESPLDGVDAAYTAIINHMLAEVKS